MKEIEYMKTRLSYQLSGATYEEKKKAIAKLDAKFLETKSVSVAMQQFNEAAPDLSDVGN